MLEDLCRRNIYEKCRSITGSEPLCKLKNGHTIYAFEAYQDFYAPGGTDCFTVWNKDLAKAMVKQKSGSPMRKAAGLFSRKGEIICDGYIQSCFGGNWERAIREEGTFSFFMLGFESYFRKRKDEFMEKTNDIISKIPKELTKAGKIKTSSHGGVANLLKVLTKTMTEQGSSITSIAKVQYAICTQAGIWVPDEFITDVLVAMDINQKVIDGQLDTTTP